MDVAARLESTTTVGAYWRLQCIDSLACFGRGSSTPSGSLDDVVAAVAVVEAQASIEVAESCSKSEVVGIGQSEIVAGE